MKECVLTDENKEIVRRRLKEEYPNAGCALEFGSPYELLVATMLSAQCTDVRVNIVTGKLLLRRKCFLFLRLSLKNISAAAAFIIQRHPIY